MIVPKMFSHKTLSTLADSGKVTGVLLLSVNESIAILEKPTRYSDDSSCPNAVSSLYQHPDDKACKVGDAYAWNPAGSDILLEDWPFPIFYVASPEKVDFLLNDCYERFNNKEPRDWPLCAVELRAHMYSAVDTTTCQRRNRLINIFSPTHVCDPLGDQNIFYLLNDLDKVNFAQDRFADGSVTVVSVRLDAANIVDKSEIGLDSPTTGIVTLLSVANILAKAKHNGDFTIRPDKSVLFALLQGESFDYIGSSRMVYDMTEGKFPEERPGSNKDDNEAEDVEDEEKEKAKTYWPLIDLKSMDFYLELGQLFNHEDQVFLHTDDTTKANPMMSNLINQGQSVNLRIARAPSEIQGLPPASVQSALKHRRNLKHVVMTNFERSYENPFYHSIFDNASYLSPEYDYANTDNPLVLHLAKISEAVAKFLIGEVGDRNINVEANTTLINELIHCYVDTAKCDLFKAASGPEVYVHKDAPDLPLPQYVGVDRSPTSHTVITHRLLGYLTGNRLNEEEYRLGNCSTPVDQKVYDMLFLKGESPPSWFNGTKEECQDDPECGYCFNVTEWRSEAVSPGNTDILRFDEFFNQSYFPAFIIDDYDYKNTTYGAWAESSWQSTSSRVFLKASPVQDRGYLALGIIVMIMSFIVVGWTDRFAGEIFDLSAPEELDGAAPPRSNQIPAASTGQASGEVNNAAHI